MQSEGNSVDRVWGIEQAAYRTDKRTDRAILVIKNKIFSKHYSKEEYCFQICLISSARRTENNVGECAIIGSGSVVTQDICAYTVALEFREDDIVFDKD